MTDTSVQPVTMSEYFEVSQFLAREARLLDEREFDDWLALLAEDIRYTAPVRVSRMPREESKEFEPADGAAHFDESREDLAQRVRKVQTGRAWSEAPASRTRHLVTNVEVSRSDQADLLQVRSSFLLYRTRGTTYQDMFAGGRRDVLRRRSSDFGDLEIAERRILLDQTVILGNNLAVFL